MILRHLVPTLSAALLVTLLAGPALAHALLVATSPADGETVAEMPDEVRLEFNEPVEADFGQLQVSDPDGNRVDAGVPESVGQAVRVPLDPLTVAGTYSVAWRVISGDGHPVEGTFMFEVADSAVEEPEPAPTPTEEAQPEPGPTPTEEGEPSPDREAAPEIEPTAEPDPPAAPDGADDEPRGWMLLALGAIVLVLAGGAVVLPRRTGGA